MAEGLPLPSRMLLTPVNLLLLRLRPATLGSQQVPIQAITVAVFGLLKVQGATATLVGSFVSRFTTYSLMMLSCCCRVQGESKFVCESFAERAGAQGGRTVVEGTVANATRVRRATANSLSSMQ